MANSDYDFEPKSAPSQFIRLKKKGDSTKVRIAGRPYRLPQVWKEGIKAPLDAEEVLKLTAEQWYKILASPDYSVSETFCWAVIDRADNKPRILQASQGVFKSIKEFAADEDWGDPTGYDIKIVRTEEPGRGYYGVTPLPNGKPLTETEKEEVDKLDFNELLPSARPTGEEQIDDKVDAYIEQMANDSDDSSPKTGHDQAEETANKLRVKETFKPEEKEDIVIEDISDEPINLDDIPF
jgi:hypothetical protein